MRSARITQRKRIASEDFRSSPGRTHVSNICKLIHTHQFVTPATKTLSIYMSTAYLMETVCATENTKVANCWQDITLESRETLELLHKKKTVANSISPILHPSRCVLAFMPTTRQTTSSMSAHLQVLLNWLHVFVARSVMVQHNRRRRQNVKVQILILEHVTQI